MKQQERDNYYREIRQLIFTASHYIDEAQRILKEAEAPSRELLEKQMTHFENLFRQKSFSGNKREEKGVFLGAHLASAAVRLVTIEERLRSLGHLTNYGSFQDLVKNVGDEELLEDSFRTQIGDCIHILLRDNIGHIEPPESGPKAWYQARQDVLKRLNLGQLADLIPKVRDCLKGKLVESGIL